MDIGARMQYLKSIYQRYQRSTRREKREILNEFSKVCKYNRKYAIRILNGPAPDTRKNKPKREREKIYGHRVISILEAIWSASDYLCSQRLKAALPLWIPRVKERFAITAKLKRQLLSISPATIDRRLSLKRGRIKKKIYGTTRPGTLLKHQIPIKTDNWDVHTPGFLEVDLVSHSGASAEGNFIHSLNCTDIHTTWTETRAVMGRGQTMTLKAFEDIKEQLPFPLKGIDSDNDGAFINYHLKAFCDRHKIQFTRGRPYKKDDNAHIEQKNWTHVRRIFGYFRYDTEEVLELINDLYSNELKWFTNFFQPSVKLVKKIRIGSKLKRIYNEPKTPFQRVCECKEADSEKIAQLKKLFRSLDPFELSQTIEKKLTKIQSLATKITKSQRTYLPKYSEEETVLYSSNPWLHS